MLTQNKVIGTAIALNILLKVPLVAGCAISIVDVLVILIFYNPSGMSMRALRTFEFFVILLVLGVVVCFCYELSQIQNVSVGEVFKGYLPSSAIVESKGYVAPPQSRRNIANTKQTLPILRYIRCYSHAPQSISRLRHCPKSTSRFRFSSQ